MGYAETLNGIARKVTDSIYTYSCDFRIGNSLSVGARMIAIKSGTSPNFIIYSVVPCSDEVIGQMNELLIQNGDLKKGESLLNNISYLVVPNGYHDSAVPEYKKKNPNIKVVAPFKTPTLGDENVDYRLSKDFGDRIIGTDDLIKAGLPKDSDLVTNGYQFAMLASHSFADIMMYHPSDKALLEADLLMNFPKDSKKPDNCDTYYEQFNGENRLTGVMGYIYKKFATPSSWLNSLVASMLISDQKAVSKVFKEIDQKWEFEKIVLIHGEVVERNGKSVWSEAFKKFLK